MEPGEIRLTVVDENGQRWTMIVSEFSYTLYGDVRVLDEGGRIIFRAAGGES